MARTHLQTRFANTIVMFANFRLNIFDASEPENDQVRLFFLRQLEACFPILRQAHLIAFLPQIIAEYFSLGRFVLDNED